MDGMETHIEVNELDTEKKKDSVAAMETHVEVEELKTGTKCITDGSTRNRYWCVFTLAIMTGAGLSLGYYFGFHEDHFTVYKRNGIRYGADYGHVNASSLPMNDTMPQQWCADRRCCHPTNGVSDVMGELCWDLTQSECCELIAQDICDWNCDRNEPNVREDHVVRDGRKRNKLCDGHNDELVSIPFV